MVLRMVAVGRVRDPALRAACVEYLARIRRYMRLEIGETADRVGRGRAPVEVRRAEGTALLRLVPEDAGAVALTRCGRPENSEGLARRVGTWQREGRDVVMVIGGAYGLDPLVLARCETRLSLSTLTLPHELARLVLLEQLYRACTILKGEPYHKGATG